MPATSFTCCLTLTVAWTGAAQPARVFTMCSRVCLLSRGQDREDSPGQTDRLWQESVAGVVTISVLPAVTVQTRQCQSGETQAAASPLTTILNTDCSHHLPQQTHTMVILHPPVVSNPWHLDTKLFPDDRELREVWNEEQIKGGQLQLQFHALVTLHVLHVACCWFLFHLILCLIVGDLQPMPDFRWEPSDWTDEKCYCLSEPLPLIKLWS